MSAALIWNQKFAPRLDRTHHAALILHDIEQTGFCVKREKLSLTIMLKKQQCKHSLSLCRMSFKSLKCQGLKYNIEAQHFSKEILRSHPWLAVFLSGGSFSLDGVCWPLLVEVCHLLIQYASKLHFSEPSLECSHEWHCNDIAFGKPRTTDNHHFIQHNLLNLQSQLLRTEQNFATAGKARSWVYDFRQL